ncbi:F-box/WD-40 repeat-containing protein, partial [Tanacetum coccineum]
MISKDSEFFAASWVGCRISSKSNMHMETHYVDPQAVVGCEDGRARVFNMYGKKWSRIIKMHEGPVTRLSFSDDQLLIGGSSYGRISLSDLSFDQQVAALKTNDYADLSTLCYNSRSHTLFAGSRSGRATAFDLRTMKRLWE